MSSAQAEATAGTDQDVQNEHAERHEREAHDDAGLRAVASIRSERGRGKPRPRPSLALNAVLNALVQPAAPEVRAAMAVRELE